MKIVVDLLLIGMGGALGAISRFGITEIMRYLCGKDFPIGTLLANLVGCFLIGILIGSGDPESNPKLRLAFGVGFLGSLTTFSTFTAETVNHANQGQIWHTALNVGLHLVLGFAAVLIGIWLGRKTFGG